MLRRAPYFINPTSLSCWQKCFVITGLWRVNAAQQRELASAAWAAVAASGERCSDMFNVDYPKQQF